MQFLPYDYWYTLPSLTIKNEETHIWYIDLVFPDEKMVDFQKFLSPDEQERAARFHFDRHRKQFILSHAATRIILANYLQQETSELKFSYGKYGKPKIDNIEFNLSHSENKALLAVNKHSIVGIDIEYMKESVSFENIAERYFASDEVAELSKISVEQKKIAFFRGWTRKEAYVKAIGDGLTMPLSDFSVPLLSINNLTIQHKNNNHGNWGIWNIDVGENYTAAIVVATENTQFKNFLM